MCAAKGMLPGQHGDRRIRFAFAPSKWLQLSQVAHHPWGACDSYAPKGCMNGVGFGSSDIFFFETCFYSLVCRNREELWRIDAGVDFVCVIDEDGFDQLRDWVLRD